ncbi:unnamed protein product [Onchocerca flexuosa]|uniref:SLC12 domain-containing protein n=1 Tax=Onchocerca flexuosa TaxID=387005 RepID=A0A183HHV3_9BILA|nr:unnamed protein product [Onchocerca flexuosa]
MRTYDIWDASRESFKRRKRGERVDGQPVIFKQTTIDRLCTVYPNKEEHFSPRMLLVNVPGSIFFQQLKISTALHMILLQCISNFALIGERPILGCMH